MKPTRKTQPYRKNKARTPGQTLEAILRGEPTQKRHPAAARRSLQKNRRAIRASVRRGKA